MRRLFYHVVTTLVPELLGKDALLNETVAEIERRALEEAERTSPRYVRGKEVRRRGYARYRFLKGFKVSLRGRRVVYGLEWVTVRLPVLYRGGKRVRTRVEEELLREEGLVLRSLLLLYSVLGGKLNAKLWTQELEVRGDFKYVVVDGKYVKLRGGRRGVLLIALGLTDHGVRAVLDVVLTREEDVVSYWDLLVRLWRRYNLTLVVADGVKALDTAISRSGIKVARQTCLVHLKRRVDRRVRVLLDLLLSLAESVPTRVSPLLSYLLAPRELWPLLRSNNLAESFNSLLERRRFGKCHSPWRILQIARAIALNYNLSTCYLALVIILHGSLFLREMVKYIQ